MGPALTVRLVPTSFHLAADRKNPQRVYACDHGGDLWNPKSGKFYRATDGGRTFSVIAQTWAPNGNAVAGLVVNRFVEGNVWLADAIDLWHPARATRQPSTWWT